MFTIGYYNWIFLFSIFAVFFCFFFGTTDYTEALFFQKVHLYIWAVAGHKLGTLII